MSISQVTPGNDWFSTPEGAAWLTASRTNPSMSFDQFHTAWMQANPSGGQAMIEGSDPAAGPPQFFHESDPVAGPITGGPVAQAPGGYAPQAGRDTPGTGTYGQTGGAYDFGSLLHPAVPVAPAPAGSTPAVGVNPPSGGIGGDGGGSAGGDKDQGPSGEAPGTPAGKDTRGSLSKENASLALDAIGLAASLAMGNPVTAAIKGAAIAKSVFGAKSPVDPVDPVTGAVDNSQNNQNSVDNNNNSAAANGMQGVGTSVGSGNTEGASGAMGGPGNASGAQGVGGTSGTADKDGGAGQGGGIDPNGGAGGHGTDAGSNDASDGPGGGAGAWAAGGLLPPAKGGHRSGEVSGRGFTKIANGIRAYGMGFADGGFATANTRGVGAGRSIPHGLVPGISSGRADAVHASVKKGSYIMPADVVSALGGGNTASGGNKLDHWVGGAGGTFKTGAGMPGTGYATGGLVDVRLSSGEYHLPPEFVRWLGKGDPEKGARVLDGHVARIRANHVKHLRNLPPPK